MCPGSYDLRSEMTLRERAWREYGSTWEGDKQCGGDRAGEVEGEGGGKKAGEEMMMEVWKEMGKEVSMEKAEGGKEGEEGDEYVGEDGGGRRRWGRR